MLPLANEAKRSAPCQHYDEGCGGCALQEYDYEAQVQAKATSLRALYGRDVPIVKSRDEFGYRSRMDYVLAFAKKGLRRRGGHARVVDTPHCLLLPEFVQPIWLAARALIEASGLPDYNYIVHLGYLKYLVIRTSVVTRETMLILTTARNDAMQQQTHALLEILAKIPGVTSVWWTINDTPGDRSIGEPKEHRGSPTITEDIAGVRLHVGPKTFSQGNAQGASEMFTRAVAHAQGRVLDLCCGTGVLGILVAKRDDVTSVVGVDVVEESITAARENATVNNVKNKCEFRARDLTEFLRDCVQRKESFDTVLCDPARPGLGSAACDLLVRLAPKKIIYISCNPITHRQDVSILSRKYDVALLEGHDLFPQTEHIEILSVLERKN